MGLCLQPKPRTPAKGSSRGKKERRKNPREREREGCGRINCSPAKPSSLPLYPQPPRLHCSPLTSPHHLLKPPRSPHAARSRPHHPPVCVRARPVVVAVLRTVARDRGLRRLGAAAAGDLFSPRFPGEARWSTSWLPAGWWAGSVRAWRPAASVSSSRRAASALRPSRSVSARRPHRRLPIRTAPHAVLKSAFSGPGKGAFLEGVALGDLAQGGYEPLIRSGGIGRQKIWFFGAILVAGDCGWGLVCRGPGVRGPVRWKVPLLNLPFSAIAVVFVGAWGLWGCGVKMDAILMISLSILSTGGRNRVLCFFLFKRLPCYWLAHTLGYTLGKGDFPSTWFLFMRNYIYGGMAPSFDFAVVIWESSAWAIKDLKFEQWWSSQDWSKTSWFLLHWLVVSAFACTSAYDNITFFWKKNNTIICLPLDQKICLCWLPINWIRLSKVSIIFGSHAAAMETRWWLEKTRFSLPSLSLSSRKLTRCRARLCWFGYQVMPMLI